MDKDSLETQQKRRSNRVVLALLAAILLLLAVLLGQSYLAPAQPKQTLPAIKPLPSETSTPPNGISVSDDLEAVLRLAGPGYASALNPQQADQAETITLAGNLFMQLLQFDAQSRQFVPEVATGWQVSEDGQTYTFSLRGDIPWVAVGADGELRQVLDEQGVPRFVTAADFVAAIEQICSGAISTQYAQALSASIANCAASEDEESDEGTPLPIGAEALAPLILEIKLAAPAGYFPSMAAMWTLSAIPHWLVEELGTEWAAADNIVTSGRFALQGWLPDEEVHLLRNIHLPVDLQGGGNIERVELSVLDDVDIHYALWLAVALEVAPIPEDLLSLHIERYSDELFLQAESGLFFLAFAHDKTPFDDVNVRAAFSAAIDRESFVIEQLRFQGIAMAQLGPSSVFGAPARGSVGLGFDPDFAREQLAVAGYADCVDFPAVKLLGFSGLYTLKWLEFAIQSWVDELGCHPSLFRIEQVALPELVERTSVGDDEVRPHIWTFGWVPEFGDEENLMGSLLACDSEDQWLARDCSALDELIEEAREESDPLRRAELYAEIEAGFFDAEGEFPIAPMFAQAQTLANHAWLSRTSGGYTGEQWWEWTIDLQMRASYLE